MAAIVKTIKRENSKYSREIGENGFIDKTTFTWHFEKMEKLPRDVSAMSEIGLDVEISSDVITNTKWRFGFRPEYDIPEKCRIGLGRAPCAHPFVELVQSGEIKPVAASISGFASLRCAGVKFHDLEMHRTETMDQRIDLPSSWTFFFNQPKKRLFEMKTDLRVIITIVTEFNNPKSTPNLELHSFDKISIQNLIEHFTKIGLQQEFQNVIIIYSGRKAVQSNQTIRTAKCPFLTDLWMKNDDESANEVI